MTTIRKIGAITAALSLTVEALLGIAWAGSTFIGSTVMEIGQDGRQVKIRTLQGESFSLDVANPEVIKGVNKGDQVSLELDSQDRVNKMVKVGGEAERPKPRTSGEQEY
jgi:hypothetical protein